MEVEGGPPGRAVTAGAALVGGLLLGTALSIRFGWFPYYWQWLAYHSGLVALVSIYLLLPEKWDIVLDEPPDEAPRASRPRILFGAAVVVRRLGETWVSERVVFRPNGRPQVERHRLRVSRRTARTRSRSQN